MIVISPRYLAHCRHAADGIHRGCACAISSFHALLQYLKTEFNSNLTWLTATVYLGLCPHSHYASRNVTLRTLAVREDNGKFYDILAPHLFLMRTCEELARLPWACKTLAENCAINQCFKGYEELKMFGAVV